MNPRRCKAVWKFLAGIILIFLFGVAVGSHFVDSPDDSSRAVTVRARIPAARVPVPVVGFDELEFIALPAPVRLRVPVDLRELPPPESPHHSAVATGSRRPPVRAPPSRV